MNFANTIKKSRVKKAVIKIVSSVLAAAVVITSNLPLITADAATTLTAPVPVAESKYDSADTHPYNHQIDQLWVEWQPVKGAAKYEVQIWENNKWTYYTTVTKTYCKATDLERTTVYYFRVRAVNGKNYSPYSKCITLKTARMNFDAYGWEAMCRLVYHEVGGINGDEWNAPIVYVSDCIVNQFVSAKYCNDPLWTPYYKKYNTIQQILFLSGGFITDYKLKCDGGIYENVPERVKAAVYGAVYGKTELAGIANDWYCYYWCNRSYKITSWKINHTFKIPWGYFYIWNTFWG